MFELTFYSIFAAITWLASIVIIPRNLYKKYFLYGLLFGGVGASILTSIIHFMGFLNYKYMGVTSIFGIFSFWTPISWTFFLMIYFYLLPERNSFLVPYILAFTTLNYSVGMVMSQSGLYETIGVYKYIQPFVFLIWNIISAWVFHKGKHRIMTN